MLIDEAKFKVNQLNPYKTCDRSMYKYNIEGYRYDEGKVAPDDEYRPIIESFFSLREDSSDTRLIDTYLDFNPTNQMWPGEHEVVITAKYKHYTKAHLQFSPITTLLYYDRELTDVCKVDKTDTTQKF